MAHSVKTIADIAKLAGVAKSTVSRALNNSPLVNEKTRLRIQKIAQEAQFAVHQGARELSLQATKTLALCIPVYPQAEAQALPPLTDDPFFLQILSGVMAQAQQAGYQLLLSNFAAHDSQSLAALLYSKKVDALMIIGNNAEQFALPKVLASQYPIVFYGRPSLDNVENSAFSALYHDDQQGGQLALQHLAKQGCQHIAFLGGHRQSLEVQARLQGFLAAKQRCGLPHASCMQQFADFSLQSGLAHCQQLLANNPKLDAIVACSDLLAMAAIQTIEQQGLACPQQVKVIGYDDIELGALAVPALSTIRQQGRLIGQQLVQIVVQQLLNKQVEIVQRMLPVSLQIRQSG